MTPRLVYGAPEAFEPDRSGDDAIGAATITASYIKHGKKWRVLIRPVDAPRIARRGTEPSKARKGAGSATSTASAGPARISATRSPRQESQTHPGLSRTACRALPALRRRAGCKLGNLRRSTASSLREPADDLGVPAGRRPAVDASVTAPEEVGAVLLAIRKAEKSAASVEQVRCPLTRSYQWQQNVHRYSGPNPAAESEILHRQAAVEEGPEARRPVVPPSGGANPPRGLPGAQSTLGGLSHGLLWRRPSMGRDDRASVIRTSTGSASACTSRAPGPKVVDGSSRARTARIAGKLPAATMAALRGHLEAMDLEASVKGWTPATRQLVFPNTVGPDHPLWGFPRAGMAAAPGRRETPLAQAARHAPQLRDVDARAGRSSFGG